MSAAHQTLRTQWFGDKGLRARGSPKVTYAMLWGGIAHQTNKYSGLMAHGSPSVTYTMVWGRIVHPTSQIHEFEYPWLTKRYVYIGLRTHGSLNHTNIIVLNVFLAFHVLMFSCYS